MPRVPNIEATLPALQEGEQKLHEYANNVLGIDYQLAAYGAFRDEADTEEIMGYREDDYAAAVRVNPKVAQIPINTWRPIAPFGSSYHNYGAAFDVQITDKGNFESADTALSALKAVASRFGLRSSVPNDPPHFELPVSLADARRMWADYSGDDVPELPPSSGAGDVAALATVAVVGAVILAVRKLMK